MVWKLPTMDEGETINIIVSKCIDKEDIWIY